MSDEHAAVISIDNPEMGWVVIGMRTHVAVIPTHEDGHALSTDCWCQPKRDDADEAPVPLITHRDIGEREGLGELTAAPALEWRPDEDEDA